MTDLFHLWKSTGETVPVSSITPADWSAIQSAATFRGVSGRRADHLTADEHGNLFLVDSCGEAHAVDPLRFLAVRP